MRREGIDKRARKGWTRERDVEMAQREEGWTFRVKATCILFTADGCVMSNEASTSAAADIVAAAVDAGGEDVEAAYEGHSPVVVLHH